MGRGAWWATIHGVTGLDTTEQLSTHITSQLLNIFITSKRNPIPFSYHLPIAPVASPDPKQPRVYFPAIRIFQFFLSSFPLFIWLHWVLVAPRGIFGCSARIL